MLIILRISRGVGAPRSQYAQGRPGRLTVSLGRSDTSSLISHLPLLTTSGRMNPTPTHLGALATRCSLFFASATIRWNCSPLRFLVAIPDFLRGYFSRCRSPGSHLAGLLTSFVRQGAHRLAPDARVCSLFLALRPCYSALFIHRASFLRGYFSRCRSPGSHLAGRAIRRSLFIAPAPLYSLRRLQVP